MDSISGLPQQIIEALERNWIVLTANQRAARSLRHAFDLRQRSLGIAFWQPPAILAWDAWLKDQWYRLLMDGHVVDLLLNSSQEQTLWRAIIAADSSTASLRPVDSLAQTAADAWLRLHQFRARQLLQTYPGNADTRAFARWTAEFDRRCARAQYLTKAQLPDAIRNAVVACDLALNAGLLLVGFDSIKPAQTALLDALRATGLDVEELAPPPIVPSVTLADAPDEHNERTACARWLSSRLIDQPTSSIAVILPSIETSRAEIDRTFRRILAPELDSIEAPAGMPARMNFRSVSHSHKHRSPPLRSTFCAGHSARSRSIASRLSCSLPTSQPRPDRPNTSPVPSSTPSSCATSISCSPSYRSTACFSSHRIAATAVAFRSCEIVSAFSALSSTPQTLPEANTRTLSGPPSSTTSSKLQDGPCPHSSTASNSRPAASGRALSMSSPRSTSTARNSPSATPSPPSNASPPTLYSRPSPATRRSRSWGRSSPQAPASM